MPTIINTWVSRFGRPREIGRKPALVVAIAFAVLLLPFVRSQWDWDGLVQECIEDAGFTFILAAIAGRCWAALYIGGRKSRELVTRGPYSVVRNPLYVSSFIGAFGMGACSGSLVIATTFAGIAMFFFRSIAEFEDAELARRFGKAFEDYRTAVPRFLPAPRLWRDEEMLEVLPKRIQRTFLDALALVLAMPVFEAIGTLQLAGVLPVLVRLP